MVYKLQDLLISMTGDFPGSDTPELRLSLRTVFDDFCERTGAWRETITQDLVADQEDYVLSGFASGDCFVHRIIEVEQNGTVRSEKTDYDFDGEATLTLTYPASAAVTDGLVVSVALRPANNISTVYVTKNFLSHWQSTIRAGVKAHMYAKPFYQERAAYFERLRVKADNDYEGGVAKARMESRRERKQGNDERVTLTKMWVD